MGRPGQDGGDRGGDALAQLAVAAGELDGLADAPGAACGELASRRVRGLMRALGGDAEGAAEDLDAAVAGLEELGAAAGAGARAGGAVGPVQTTR